MPKRIATNTGFELGHSRLYREPQRTWFTPGNLAVLTLVSFIVGIVAGTISGL